MNRRFVWHLWGFFMIGSVVFPADPSPAAVQDDRRAAAFGYEIMRRVFDREDGEDGRFVMTMRLVDKRGHARERRLVTLFKDFGNRRKTLITFTAPPDIEGTRFLSWENGPDEDDTQYLYLPALGRSRRIVSSQKGLRFVNSDLTYEDLQRRPPDKDDHRFIEEGSFQGRRCYVVESRPRGRSQYSRRVQWVDQESLLILRVDFYDRKGRKSKDLIVRSQDRIDGIWTAMTTRIHDLKEDHVTVLEVTEVRYDQGLGEETFSLRHLEQ